MQSQTEELTSTLDTLEAQKRTPKSFTLYEEYSQTDIAETIRTRRTNYNKATLERRKKLEEQVESEVNKFRRWLEETKNLEPNTAHYHAISLKGLLLGLPTGVQIAQLFDIALTRASSKV
ncbi:MAG: hypothetical protein ABSF24_00195 [Candidatus Bathyarchaeia archaeon]|jgi:hypothetical protein